MKVDVFEMYLLNDYGLTSVQVCKKNDKTCIFTALCVSVRGFYYHTFAESNTT